MTDILAAIDSALTSHETGNPWPDRIPTLDEVVEVLFGPETGQPVPTYLSRAVLVAAERQEAPSDLRRLYGPEVRVRPEEVAPVPVLVSATARLRRDMERVLRRFR